jgi:hypothetical protein
MKLLALAVVMMFGAVACKKAGTDKPAPTTGSGSSATSGSAGSGSAGSGSATAATGSGGGSAAGSGSASATVDAPLPAVKGDDKGFLFADKPKGTVTVTIAGKKTEAPDGTLVDLLDWPDSGPENDHGELRHISVNGKQGFIASRHVVLAEDIKPAPSGDLALVTPLDGRGDFEHHAVWLVRGMGQRWRMFETAVDPTPAWHPKATSLALGGDGALVVVELPSGKELARTDKYFAPAYAPDGTLYVRSHDWGVYTFADGKAKRIAKGKRQRKEEGEDFDPSPSPVSFDAKGKYQLDDD